MTTWVRRNRWPGVRRGMVRRHSLLHASSATITAASAFVITDAVRAAGVQGDGRLNDSSYGIWPGVDNLVSAPTNLLDASWVNYSLGGAITSGITDPLGGTSAFRLAAGAAPNYYGRYDAGTLAITTTYTVSVWLRGVPAANAHVFVGIDDAAFSSEVVPTAQWQRFQVSKTTADPVPAGGRVFQVVAQGGDAPFGLDIWWPQTEVGPVATPFTPDIRAGNGRVQLPASLLDETQGWLAMRFRPGWSNAQEPSVGGSFPEFFYWGDAGAGNNHIRSYYYTGDNNLYLERRAGGVTSGTQIIGLSVVKDAPMTIIWAWTGAQAAISVNGAAFVTGASTNIPTITEPIDIGSTLSVGNFIHGDVPWVATGKGTLSDTNAASIHASGDTDPTPSYFPLVAQLTSIWPASTNEMTVYQMA